MHISSRDVKPKTSRASTQRPVKRRPGYAGSVSGQSPDTSPAPKQGFAAPLARPPPARAWPGSTARGTPRAPPRSRAAAAARRRCRTRSGTRCARRAARAAAARNAAGRGARSRSSRTAPRGARWRRRRSPGSGSPRCASMAGRRDAHCAPWRRGFSRPRIAPPGPSDACKRRPRKPTVLQGLQRGYTSQAVRASPTPASALGWVYDALASTQ